MNDDHDNAQDDKEALAAASDPAATSAASVSSPIAPKTGKSTRPPSRPKRWAEAAANASDAVTAATEALEVLRSIQEEYQEWSDNLSESLQATGTGEKLQEVCNIDVEGALSTMDDVAAIVSEAESADLPQGFGRD